ncbi:MAG: glucose-6-phosphate isomerase [Legionellaceae bacterium]|nr:glucose-6-phosphate isomerase [Legionellaceae bacterium]
MKQLTELTAWHSLMKHAHFLDQSTQSDDTPDPVDRGQPLTASACQITLEYSRQRVVPKTLDLLIALANERGLRDKIHALMRGDKLNRSENRPALHTALRAEEHREIMVDAHNIMPQIVRAREQMFALATQIRNQQWLGFSGKAITDIVNIGVGGSDLGPRFCVYALRDYVSTELNYHFISDADPASFNKATEKLHPETTLFIISSKSFTTWETLYNAKKAIRWIGEPSYLDQHFIAVTAHRQKAEKLGIKNILPVWEWIGGRYSLCSAINLITAIAIGREQFNDLLAGARSMDEHFYHTDFRHNLPVLLALLGVWNINFLNINNLLILTYAKALDHLVPYIQQLDMESNGKSRNQQGRMISYATGPIVWGGPGNSAQHSYYQLLCQGTHRIAGDFISLQSYAKEPISECFRTKIRVLTEGIYTPYAPNGNISGGMPLNHLRLTDDTPFNIGALIALYEHKIFSQSVIWDINPFDQPGVESSKKSMSFQSHCFPNQTVPHEETL